MGYFRGVGCGKIIIWSFFNYIYYSVTTSDCKKVKVKIIDYLYIKYHMKIDLICVCVWARVQKCIKSHAPDTVVTILYMGCRPGHFCLFLILNATVCGLWQQNN